MKTAQIVKVGLLVGILFALYRLMTGARRASWNAWTVQPYSMEHYGEEDYEDDSDAEDDDEEADEDMEDDDEEEDDMEEDEDGEEDDMEDDDEEYDDYENGIEGFSTAAPRMGAGAPGVPLMNIATDLLPKPSAKASDFGEFAPKSLLGQNFLDAKKYIGVDTQGSSLRNANYDLRSSPAIPRRDVGPWQQSTIDGDLFRKPLE